MDNTLEFTAEETIRELTLRLRRLEFLLLGGSSDPPLVPDTTSLSRENSVQARISQLDKTLVALYNHSPVVKNILDLCLFPVRSPLLAGGATYNIPTAKLNNHKYISSPFAS